MRLCIYNIDDASIKLARGIFGFYITIRISDASHLLMVQCILYIQENMEILGDGYQGDVIGESTPDVIVSTFVCSPNLTRIYIL